MFDHIRSAGRTVLFLNTVPLMDIAFLPFAASVPAAGFRTGHGQRTAVVFHGMTLLLAAILFNVTGVRAIITGCSPPPSIRCGPAPLAGASGWHLFWIATGTLLGGLLPVLGMAVIAAFIPYYWLPIRGETASAKPPGLLGALTADTRRAWPSGRRRSGRRRRLPGPGGPAGRKGVTETGGFERWCGPAALSRLAVGGGPPLPHGKGGHRASGPWGWPGSTSWPVTWPTTSVRSRAPPLPTHAVC